MIIYYLRQRRFEMIRIENNRVIIEFEDLSGFEEDVLHRLPNELNRLLQCTTILQVDYDYALDVSLYSVYALLQAINPTMEQVQALHFSTTKNKV